MRKESECKPFEKYLFTEIALSDDSIAHFKQDCILNSNRKSFVKDKYFDDFIHWKRSSNQVAIYSDFAFADVKLPIIMNCIFDLDKPQDWVNVDFTVIQSIFNGRLPIDSIEHGHRHLLILDFEQNVPQIFENLYVHYGNTPFEFKEGSTRLGFCNLQDFDAIKIRIEYTNQLKNQYGKDWWKHDIKNMEY